MYVFQFMIFFSILTLINILINGVDEYKKLLKSKWFKIGGVIYHKIIFLFNQSHSNMCHIIIVSLISEFYYKATHNLVYLKHKYGVI